MGEWVENDQQKYFENFINQVRKNAYIILYDNKDIGFYNGEVLEKYNDTDIEIQYFKQNPVGALYKKLGFEKSGETNFHYKMIKFKNIKLI